MLKSPAMTEQIIPYCPDITEQKCDLALTRQHQVSTHAGQSAGLTTGRFRVPLCLTKEGLMNETPKIPFTIRDSRM
jgi:hypothetical protein